MVVVDIRLRVCSSGGPLPVSKVVYDLLRINVLKEVAVVIADVGRRRATAQKMSEQSSVPEPLPRSLTKRRSQNMWVTFFIDNLLCIYVYLRFSKNSFGL